jgi:uroporphyrinogen III methyltransferase/synthase
MGVNNLAKITRALKRYGKSGNTPAAVVRYGTLPHQQTISGTLDSIAENAMAAELKPPALVVIGNVAALRDDINWFEKRPLFEKRIVVTRSRAQASDLVAGLESLGAQVLSFPTIKIMPPDSYERLDNAIQKIFDYAWLVFTSVNGVQVFFERLARLNKDTRFLAGTKICAIGPSTAEQLHSFGITADLQPQEFVAESIVEAFKGIDISGRRILLPRADIARRNLIEGLEALGAIVHEVVVYRTVIEDTHSDNTLNQIKSGDFDLVTFTSSSTVKNFVSRVGKKDLATAFRKAKVACIGPITENTARKFGITADIQPEKYTIPDLVEAIVKYYRGLDAENDFIK